MLNFMFDFDRLVPSIYSDSDDSISYATSYRIADFCVIGCETDCNRTFLELSRLQFACGLQVGCLLTLPARHLEHDYVRHSASGAARRIPLLDEAKHGLRRQQTIIS